jgi:hypothetical protein
MQPWIWHISKSHAQNKYLVKKILDIEITELLHFIYLYNCCNKLECLVAQPPHMYSPVTKIPSLLQALDPTGNSICCYALCNNYLHIKFQRSPLMFTESGDNTKLLNFHDKIADM